MSAEKLTSMILTMLRSKNITDPILTKTLLLKSKQQYNQKDANDEINIARLEEAVDFTVEIHEREQSYANLSPEEQAAELNQMKKERRMGIYQQVMPARDSEMIKIKKDSETTQYLNDMLKCSFIYYLLNPRHKREIIEILKPYEYKDEIVIKEGEDGDKMYFLQDGELEIVKNGEVIGPVAKGALVGEVALLHDIPRTATVRAKGNAKVWVITRQEYHTIKTCDEKMKNDLLFALRAKKKQFQTPFYSNDRDFISMCKSVFLTEGERLKDGFYFFVYNGNEVMKDGIKKIKRGMVLESGYFVVGELEGHYIPKEPKTDAV